jgi:hypothetical protein
VASTFDRQMVLRHVVVDGSNIATEGRDTPSLAQLDAAVQAFTREYRPAIVTVVVDATFPNRISRSERRAYDDAIASGRIVSAPAGAVGRGDAFVLQIADRVGASVLSNDSFQEFHGSYEWLFDEGRLVGGKPVAHVGWVFMIRAPVRGPTSRRSISAAKRATQERGAAAPVAGPDGAPTGKAEAKPSKATKARKSAKAAKGATGTKAAEGAKPAKDAQGTQAAGGAKGTEAARSAKAGRGARGTQGAKAAGGPEGTEPGRSAKAGRGAKGAADGQPAGSAKQSDGAVPAKAAKAGDGVKGARGAKAAKSSKGAAKAENATKKSARAGKATRASKAGKATKAAKAAQEGRPAAEVPGPAPGADGSDKKGEPSVVYNEALPFIEFVGAHPVGSRVDAVVEEFSSHGAYVRVDGVRAYAPLKYLGEPPPRSAKAVLKLGESRQFVVVEIDASRRGVDVALPDVAPPGPPTRKAAANVTAALRRVLRRQLT